MIHFQPLQPLSIVTAAVTGKSSFTGEVRTKPQRGLAIICLTPAAGAEAAY